MVRYTGFFSGRKVKITKLERNRKATSYTDRNESR